MIDRDVVLSELSLFADLDSTPQITTAGSDYVLAFSQQDVSVQLTVDAAGGRVIERRDGETARYGSYLGLLQSPNFGNLYRLAQAQRALILKDDPTIEDAARHLPVVGQLDSGSDQNFADGLEAWLHPSQADGTKVLVIDGPAGIGKTFLIRKLAFKRAVAFGPGSLPPLLHVQSRGKRLATLSDVVEGTLGALRHSLTADQVTVLVRNGLLQIAIDGFDELADPNGYDTAWNSLRTFIGELGGKGTLILAGRDTLIDAKSVKKALKIAEKSPIVGAHLRHLKPSEAESWLRAQGLDQAKISNLQEAGLFEADSYALRPFFISQIAKAATDENSFDLLRGFPLKVLISDIVRREAKIVSDLCLEDGGEGLFYDLLLVFFEEVARDMGDAESDVLDRGSLVLIAEIVFNDRVSVENLGMIKHRVLLMPLLEADGGSDERRRFPHSEIQDYFLGQAIFRYVAAGELPVSVRRNLLGTDFLETFCDIAASSDVEEVDRFIQRALPRLEEGLYDDRGARNLPALIIAAIPGGSGQTKPEIRTLVLDEVVVRGVPQPILLSVRFISQLDARGSDLSAMEFERVDVARLLADQLTILPESFPTPKSLSVVGDGPSGITYDEGAISGWLEAHRREPQVSATARSSSLELLEKLCRITLRQTWIRVLDEDRAGRFLKDENWPSIKAILLKHGLLSVREGVGVGGPKSDFIRIARARDMIEHPTDPQIAKVLADVARL